MAYSLQENSLFSTREWPILSTKMAYSLEENSRTAIHVNLFQKKDIYHGNKSAEARLYLYRHTPLFIASKEK